jgi:putative acetyltransferase
MTAKKRKMIIRRFENRDAAALAEIFHKSVHVVGRRDYSDAQVAVRSPAIQTPEEFSARMEDGRTLLVATTAAGTPAGFIELELNGHIDRFYCHPDSAGIGIGQALYQELETTAVAAKIARLHVEASEAARRFFLREGFTLLERRDFEVRGVAIHNYKMAKVLVV